MFQFLEGMDKSYLSIGYLTDDTFCFLSTFLDFLDGDLFLTEGFGNFDYIIFPGL